jgi:hypothetical protein
MLERQTFLQPEYFVEYERLLSSLSHAKPTEVFRTEASSKWERMKYSAFWPQSGSEYKSETDLLLVGRAANGWDDGWSLLELSKYEREDLQGIVAAAAKTINSLEGWIDSCWQKGDKNNYSLGRSVFWRSAKSIVEELTNNRDSWASRIAWTNLYKVAPSGGGNPSDMLCKFQLEHCIRLLKLELDAYKPRYVLVVAGNWALEFLNSLGFVDQDFGPRTESPCILRTENRDGQKWVFTIRPDRRPPIESSVFCGQVLKAFKDESHSRAGDSRNEARLASRASRA